MMKPGDLVTVKESCTNFVEATGCSQQIVRIIEVSVNPLYKLKMVILRDRSVIPSEWLDLNENANALVYDFFEMGFVNADQGDTSFIGDKKY